MKIGLIDVDGHNFPNLPLMKISAFHKANGDKVEMYDAIMAEKEPYDKIYMSKVFSFTPDYEYPLHAKDVIAGGTGYDLKTCLPSEIESIYPDYSLYGVKNVAYGFLTRGCPRNCGFCIVSAKESCKSYKVADLDGFWKGQKEIKLLDPNLLACNERKDLLLQLVESKAHIDCTQGLDIRFMTEELAELIMKCKIKMLHFAWDKEQDSGIIVDKLREFKRLTNINYRKARVYVLTNYDTSFEFDLYRIYELKSLGYDPYVMIYDKENAEQKYKSLQRWVNDKYIFRVCDKFENYRKCV